MKKIILAMLCFSSLSFADQEKTYTYKRKQEDGNIAWGLCDKAKTIINKKCELKNMTCEIIGGKDKVSSNGKGSCTVTYITKKIEGKKPKKHEYRRSLRIERQKLKSLL